MTWWNPKGAIRPASFSRGMHLRDHKHLAAEVPIEVLPAPAEVDIPLQQHAGAASISVVAPRQQVSCADMVGRPDGLMSAAVHTPIAGRVTRSSVTTLPNGRHVATVHIKAEGPQRSEELIWQDHLGGVWPPEPARNMEAQEIVRRVADAGIVGLGGAAFPTHVKLTRLAGRVIDCLLINGCECEPFLTADYRLMVEAPGSVLAGAQLAAFAVGAKKTIIAIEDNKPAAVEIMRAACKEADVQVVVVRTKYPAGSERQLIPAVLGRTVPADGLPHDAGVVVFNVGTAAAVARAVLRGSPLTHRIVTVSGNGIAVPKNVLTPIGASFRNVISHCGGLTTDSVRVVAGGPMMGFTSASLDVPVTKGTCGITVLRKCDLSLAPETACIRCGRCVDVCPMHLVPTRIALAARHRDLDLARKYHIRQCCECGCCALVCPASIPLVQLIRSGKAWVNRDEGFTE